MKMVHVNESALNFNNVTLTSGNLATWQTCSILLTIIASFTLNGLVLLRNITFRAKFARSYMVRCFLMCNLATADLFQSTIGYSLQIISLSRGFAPKLCQASGFVISLFAYASIINTITISIESYIHICRPWIKQKITASRLSFQIFCSFFAWLYALFWAALPLVHWNDYSNVIMNACTINWNTKDHSQRSFIICLFLFCIVIPFVLLAVCSIQNNKEIRKMKNYALKHFGAKSPAVIANIKAESSILRLTLIGAIAFLISWLPYSSFSLLRFFGIDVQSQWYSIMEKVASLCAKLSCLCNPLIYAYSEKSFRGDARKMLKGILCRFSLKEKWKGDEHLGNEMRVLNSSDLFKIKNCHLKQDDLIK